MFCYHHRAADIRKLFIFISLCLLSAASLLPAAGASTVPPQPAFISETSEVVSSNPYVTLKWEIPGEDEPDATLRYEVEGARTPDFAEVTFHYQGPDTASYLSGLLEGDYFFRVRSFREETNPGPWSDPLHLKIKYDSLATAFTLFGIGAVVSIATVALVVIGDRRTRREEEANA